MSGKRSSFYGLMAPEKRVILPMPVKTRFNWELCLLWLGVAVFWVFIVLKISDMLN